MVTLRVPSVLGARLLLIADKYAASILLMLCSTLFAASSHSCWPGALSLKGQRQVGIRTLGNKDIWEIR